MTTKRTLKTSSTSMVIGALNTSTSSSMLTIRGYLARNVTPASTRTTKRMWCCTLFNSMCLLSSDATASRSNGITTTMRASSTCRLLCHMSSSRWHHNTSSQMCLTCIDLILIASSSKRRSTMSRPSSAT